jgi:exonuclease SbcC
LRLDLHGFTVFREPTTVDFTDADFFVLVGPTGSGKSTILDAICFALYGTVPRWGDRRRIDNALAPSSAQARVRLVFEASGARYVATRVVRRDGKGKVSTTHAGLEQLPNDFDPASFDEAPAERGEALGTVLAGTPAEMDEAVLAAVGLPYEQFTKCVVLPQGEFARFLHAKPAERQEILVNLLGLHVYQRVGERAGVRQREAEARVAATRSLLGDVTGADDEALAGAEQALLAARRLVGEVESHLPALEQARTAGERAATELDAVRRELAALQTVRPPAALAGLHTEVSAARDAARAAQSDVDKAEDAEEKARAELAAAGDRTALTRLLDAHAERTRHAERVGAVAGEVAAATAEQEKVATRLARAQAAAEKAAAASRTALAAVEAATTADRAASLRVHLVAGQPCPVCEQEVLTVPTSGAPKLRAARERAERAEQAERKAAETVKAEDRALREAERRLATVAARHQESSARLAALESTLDGAPDVSAVQVALAAIAEREQAAAAAAETVRAARQALRGAATRLATAEDGERRAWREYDAARDAVAALGPPAADRERLVDSWQALHAWAVERHAERSRARDGILADADAALTALAEVTAALDALIPAQGKGSRDAAAYRQAAALAVERATAARDRVLERRAQAEKLREQLAAHERDAQVAKALAQHLRANQFERWLLTEALDALVGGASRILNDLSGGRYDLAHADGEFTVVDHADASLRRGVRTLSGGETFQASLALALALSEQLAGLAIPAQARPVRSSLAGARYDAPFPARHASASLESIMLDEGFGTLDADTMDTVAATLENLAARGDRMVGVVTHVAALAERIPVRFEVSRDPRGTARVTRDTGSVAADFAVGGA